MWLRYFYILLTLLIILSLIPTGQKFKYDYELGKPWAYEDLLAPFSFPILKSESEIKQERDDIEDEFEPYYEKNPQKEQLALNAFEDYLSDNIGEYGEEDKIDRYRKVGKGILETIYNKGIIELEPTHRDREDLQKVHLIENRVANRVSLSSLYKLQELKTVIQQRLEPLNDLNKELLRNALIPGLQPDIIYASDISKQKLEEQLTSVSQNHGMVEAGELIIQKGLTVTEEEFQKLNSLKSQYDELVKAEGRSLQVIGYFVLILVIFLIYIGYIQLFQIGLIRKNRRLLLMLITFILFVFLSRYVIRHESLNIMVLPYCIVPIVVLAFFDYKLAIITHLVVILMVGSFVPNNAAEFIVIQFIAGFVSILTMVRVQYLSQFFISTLYILLSYVVTYGAFKLLEVRDLKEIEFTGFLWLGGNFMLTLLGYPLIYAYEKLFGFVSDITLVELADINKKLLRKLSVRAPGTFQHSLQVANLSESVVNRIGGRTLLTRVGALYHDIGKMENPEYFIENQKYIDNPHDALSEEDSAKVIIDHVNKGVKIARNDGLPPVIVNFIRTHHGTSRVEYFYRNYLKKVPAHQVDETKFRYPGPKPAGREQAVVMICDSVEAAVRSLHDKNSDNISKMVDGIIEGKINDGQLQSAPITLHEIEIIRKMLKELLATMYHVRIEYPDKEAK